MRNEPCQIGSIRPRRQALERRTLHPSKPTVPSGKQWFQSSNNWLSRFVNLHTRRWRGQMRKDDKPHWLHKSATPSPRATYTPDSQIHKPNLPRRLHNNSQNKVTLWKTLVSKFELCLICPLRRSSRVTRGRAPSDSLYGTSAPSPASRLGGCDSLP